MNVLSPKAALWVPSVGSFVLVMIASVATITGHQRLDWSGVMYSLPVIFITIAHTTVRYVSQLEKRVADLEQRLSEKAR